MRPCQGRDDGATPFTRSTCPRGVVQPTRLPLMQEITGAKPVRDASFFALKALSAMHSLGKRVSPVQLRVGAPISQSSQRSNGFHKPAVSGAAPGTATTSPPCSSLRISFVRQSRRGSTGGRLHSFCSRSPMQRHDVESVASAGASPAASTSLRSSLRCELRLGKPVTFRAGLPRHSAQRGGGSRSHSRPASGFYPD